MKKEFSRTQRVADFLKRELANTLQFEFRDPRLGMVSITEVEVSRDLSYAKVFVTVLGKDDEEQAAPSIEVLNHAAGYLRTQVARSNNARTTPKLRFYFDTSISRGRYLSDLIDRAVAADKDPSDPEHQRED